MQIRLAVLATFTTAATVLAWHSPANQAGSSGSWSGQMVILKSTTGFFVDMPDGKSFQKAVVSRTDYYVYKEVDDRLYIRNQTEDGWIKREVALLPSEAIAHFDDIIRRRAALGGTVSDPSAHTRRARAHEYNLDLDAAIRDYDAAIGIAPSFAWYNNRGNLHAKKHNVRAAIADYESAINLLNNSPILYTNYGNNLRKIAEFDKAATAYDNALKADPRHIPAILGKASLLREKKDFPAAMVRNDLAVAVDPRSGQALVERGETSLAMGDGKRAEADFARSLEVDPIHLDAHIQRSLLRVRAKDYPAAILECDEANLKDGKRGVIWIARARIHFASGNPAAGLADLERAIEREPRSPSGYNAKAWILATHPDAGVRDGRRAVEAAKKACEMTENKAARLLDTLAAAHAEAGEFESAIAAMKKVLEDPFVAARDAVKSKARLALYETKVAYRENPLDTLLSP